MVDTALERRASADLDQYDPIDADYRILDVYAGGIADEEPRIEALATISAGAKNEKGIPIRSTDGRIFLHDPNNRAPGLQAALEETAYRRLTIAFPSNDLSKVVQQRYACYSATQLRAYGDEHVITVLEGGRREVRCGEPDYDRWIKQCKVQASFYVCLADWDQGEPIIDFPDGFGYYRLRTTSRNSIRSLLSTIHHIRRFTNGRIAGIPFELGIEQRDVATADGKRQRVPVWVMVMRPPGGLTLNSRTLQRINRQALAAGESLMLPAPARETIDGAVAEVGTAVMVDDESDYNDEQIALLERGAPCNEDHWRKKWHATVKDTYLANDAERHTFIARYSNGRTESLTKFLSMATEEEANALVLAAQEALETRRDLVETDAIEANLEDGAAPDDLTEESADAADWDQPHPPAAEPSVPYLDGSNTEATMVAQWKQSVQLRMTKARTGAGATPVDKRDRDWVMNIFRKLAEGDNRRALAILNELTGRPVVTTADLSSGEANVLRDIVASTTQRPLLDRLANPQGALV